MLFHLIIVVFLAKYPAGAVSYATRCGQYEWACQNFDGTCISSSQKCDGVSDCLGGSDESHAVCWDNPRCKDYEFRCTYGACVDGDWPCNGHFQCADGSDEQLSRCRNETLIVHATFKCKNGETIPSDQLCDGRVHCVDGSDETLQACSDQRCRPDLFQCAYGACVDADAPCDPFGILHCYDGSDEADSLCNIKENRPSKFCILPEKSDYMTYMPIDHKNATTGEGFSELYLKIVCSENRTAVGSEFAECKEGFWIRKMSQCPKDCIVPINDGIKYMCPGNPSRQPCKDAVPSGTYVDPQCEVGYNQENPRLMQCVDAVWDHQVRCELSTMSCGKPSGAQPTMMGGRIGKKNEVPWHAGIYDKHLGYKQICGGSLVSQKLVISVAHCFWDDVAQQLPHTRYVVSLGQLRRQWKNDTGQWFNVSSIKLHDSFRAEITTWGYDIALVVLDRPATYGDNVYPVCLDLNNAEFNERQLAHGQLGRIAGWGLTAQDGVASEELIVNELSTINNSICIDKSHDDFKKYITPDKICAGNVTGTGLCQGDSGGGLVFRDEETGAYYLRGLASIRHRDSHECTEVGFNAFTRVFHYANFIKNNNKS